MKTIRLLIIALFFVSTVAHAADYQALTLQSQEEAIQQMTQEMSALGISKEKARRMLTHMYQKGFQHGNIVRAQNIIMNAANDDLPTEPIMNKAMEGMVKQAKEQQVIEAMSVVRNRHEYAYRKAASLTKDPKKAQAMAGAIADSLAAGMSPQDMDQIMARLQVRTRHSQTDDISLPTFDTVRRMARLGASTTDVSDTINQALLHQYTARQMEQLRHAYTRDTQHTPASQLAHQYAGAIGKGENPGNTSASSTSDSSGNGNSGSGSGSGNGGDSGGGGDSGSGGGPGGGGPK